MNYCYVWERGPEVCPLYGPLRRGHAPSKLNRTDPITVLYPEAVVDPVDSPVDLELPANAPYSEGPLSEVPLYAHAPYIPCQKEANWSSEPKLAAWMPQGWTLSDEIEPVHECRNSARWLNTRKYWNSARWENIEQPLHER